MNKLILLFILCLSCTPKPDLTLHSVYKESKISNENILLPSGAFVHSYDITDNGIEYAIGVKEDRIVFICTKDERFSIDGLRINDLLPDSCHKEWRYRPGWGYYIGLCDGWYAGHDYQAKPNEQSRIQWFFKYDF